MAGSTSGIIAGMNALEYSSSSPYTLFFFQAIVILTFSQLINIPLSKIKQPRVLAEVLTGIVLSHTMLGRIPNFTDYMFPTDSRQGLTLTANIGICLLMFIVGCEVDVKFIKKHLVTALSVGIFNMAVPFGLGCACAVGLWKDYRLGIEGLPEIKFTTFMVFIATAMCITAFPVLVRILTELRLVKDRVGTVVLAAGITNDLLGWILLALSITLANSEQSMITLYIVLVAIGWCILVCFPLRWILHFILKNFLKEFDDPNSPSRTATLIILILMFSSAFFTDIIGVHPIFGAFLVGTIVPRENNYVINLTSRIEDLVNIIFVPIYFGVSGLDVDLGLLNKGLDWGWAIGLIFIALIGKIVGGLVAAKLRGLYWRESFTVGVLMSCKGIVEIVVLQVGLNAKIISQKTYSMFIFMAIITTFLTTPLTIYSYPESYRENVQQWIAEKQKEKLKKKKSKNNMNIGNDSDNDDEKYNIETIKNLQIDKLIIPIDNVESVSNGLLLLDMFLEILNVPIHVINLKTLTERTADLLHASMMDEFTPNYDHDLKSLNSVLSIFKIFCHFNKIPFTSEILYSLPESYVQTLFDNSLFSQNDLLILPISQRQFSIDFLTEILSESERENKDYSFKKAIFINRNHDLKPEGNNDKMISKLNGSEVQEKNMNEHQYEHEHEHENGITKKGSPSESKSYLSDDTMLSPSSLIISTITLYLGNSELTDKDKLGMKLFDILIRRKDLVAANVVLTNIENTSKTYDMISTWISSNNEIFKNDVHLKMAINPSSLTDTIKNDDSNTSFDRLVLISAQEENLELISKLVSINEKVFVLV